ncbi:MAG: mannose-1-phosphate guanylyltransferase [Deltaproteobacteria bacterium]|nr:mannose-1-phosphate guanylyltransferase [Deltaproteobacteria bacterium]
MERLLLGDTVYALIMAGGSGTRFWPRSRENRPKQLLDITGDEILLKKTVDLIKEIISFSRIYIITTEAQADAIRKVTPEIPYENILIEPFGKNTAPAIGLSSLYIEGSDPNSVVVILPADHYIKDSDSFYRTISAGVSKASEGSFILTIGIQPKGPETGYGYIETDKMLNNNTIFSVRSFHEKPDLTTARSFIKSGNFFWNSGIFMAKTSTIIQEIKTHMSHNYACLMKIRSSLGSKNEADTIKSCYQDMESISIDYGVMEKSKNVLMARGTFDWNDVGSWPSAAQYWPTDNKDNAFIGEIIHLDSTNCIVYSPKKPVALLGVEDLIVIEEDDVLMVCKKERSQDVKKLVGLLKQQCRDQIL